MLYTLYMCVCVFEVVGMIVEASSKSMKTNFYHQETFTSDLYKIFEENKFFFLAIFVVVVFTPLLGYKPLEDPFFCFSFCCCCCVLGCS